jgi:hypothetical protein
MSIVCESVFDKLNVNVPVIFNNVNIENIQLSCDNVRLDFGELVVEFDNMPMTDSLLEDIFENLEDFLESYDLPTCNLRYGYDEDQGEDYASFYVSEDFISIWRSKF